MKAHKFADIFPMMDEKEFGELKQDIKENGLMETITIFEDEILDGRNRYKACQELEIKPKFYVYEGDNALQFVISKNLKRRHLTDSQKAVVALEYKPIFEEESKRRMSIGGQGVEVLPPLETGKTRDKLGESFGVSGRYIDIAEEVTEKRPEAIEDIKEGRMSLNSVYVAIKREGDDIPTWLRFLDVWNFKENTGEGISNLPPEIIKNLLYYYTKEEDLVVDPFAGSGQTKMVCDEMKRKCFCSDINPSKPFIKKWNVDNGLPKETKECDFIFLDPPYWKMIDYGEGWSNLSLNDFYKKFDLFLDECKNVLKNGGKIALIIMPLKKEDRYNDLGFGCYKLMEKKFKVIQRLCVPLQKNWSVDPRIKEARENKELLTSSLRDLIIMEKKEE